MKVSKDVLEFAKQEGYDNAEYRGKWRGYDVYEPLSDGDGIAIIGIPFNILAKDSKLRMSTIEEAMEYLAEAAE